MTNAASPAPGTEGAKPSGTDLLALWIACSDFIRDQQITCAEATVEDCVYENAPELVERIGKIVGYHRYPDDFEDDDAA